MDSLRELSEGNVSVALKNCLINAGKNGNKVELTGWVEEWEGPDGGTVINTRKGVQCKPLP